MTGFKQFRLEGIGVAWNLKSGSGNQHRNNPNEIHPYLKQNFWLNPANQFWNSSIYSEESKIDLAKRANVIYTP